MQRKPTPQSRGPNAAEKQFLEWCKGQPSITSGQYGVEVHHCVGSSAKTYVGAERVHIGHWFCIPLTTDEHSDFHKFKKEFENVFGRQRDLWLRLVEGYEYDVPNNVVQGIINYGK